MTSTWLRQRPTSAARCEPLPRISRGRRRSSIVATAFYVGIYWTPWPQTFLIARYGYFGASLIMAAAGFTGAAALWASRADGRVEDARA